MNPGSHLTNPICKVKERVGEVWAADIDIHPPGLGAFPCYRPILLFTGQYIVQNYDINKVIVV